MNKEIIDALYMLLHCSLKDTEYETQKEQFKAVYDYICSLEQENKKYKEVFDKLKKRIDYMFQNEPVNSAEYDFYIGKLDELLKEVE